MRAGRVGHFDQNRLDQGNVKGSRHPIVEEGRVGHLAIVRVEVALGERPANALHGPTLDLALDVRGMNGLTHVLHCGVAQNLDLAGVWIDLHIDDVHGEGIAWAAGVDRALAGDRAASATLVGGDLRKGEPLSGIGFADKTAVIELDVVLGDL